MAKSELYRYSIRLPEYMNDFVIEQSDRKGLSRNQFIVACIDRIIHEEEQFYMFDRASKQMAKEREEVEALLKKSEDIRRRWDEFEASLDGK